MPANANPITGNPIAARPIAGLLLSLTLATATVVGWLLTPHARGLDPLVVAILWFNVVVVLTALGVEASRRPYSLHLMHLIAMFLFLGIASVLQYSHGILGVPGPIQTVRPQILPAASATTLWLLSYLAVYEFRLAFVPKSTARFLSRPLTLQRVTLLGGMALVGLAYLAAVGMLGANTRAAAENAVSEFAGGTSGGFAGPLFILTGNLVRSLPPVALMASLLVLSRDPRKVSLAAFPFVGIIGIGTLLVNNPFAASRMFLVACLIAFATPFFLRRFRTGWLLVVFVLIGLAFLPALGSGTSRVALELSEVFAEFRLASPLDYLAASSDVDSLGMTAICQQYVDHFGHRWGMQILGALVFWFPRTLWPGKPIGTGTMAAHALGFDFTNLAPPITAEPLVDFGLVGVPIVAGFFAWILSRLDAAYWAVGREGVAKSYRIIDALYPFWLVAIVYHTRGDLLAAMTFNVSFSLCLLPLGLGIATRRESQSIPRVTAMPHTGDTRRTAASPARAGEN